MRLATRMALHASAWLPTAGPTWQPGARAATWERGGMDAESDADGAGEGAEGAQLGEGFVVLSLVEAPLPVESPPGRALVEAPLPVERPSGRALVEAPLPVEHSQGLRSLGAEAGRGESLVARGAGVAERAVGAAPGGWTRPVMEVAAPRLDVSQVRGPAWSNGVYRLFKPGRDARGAARSLHVERSPRVEVPRAEASRSQVPRGEPQSAIEVVAPRVEASRSEVVAVVPQIAALRSEASRSAIEVVAPRVEASRSAVGAVVPRITALRSEAPRSEAPRSAVEVVAPRVAVVTPRLEVEVPPAPREPQRPEAQPGARGEPAPAGSAWRVEVVAPSVMTAAPDTWALGDGDDGIVRRVVEWPLAAAARPAVLGGALARLELPDAATWRGLVPQLAGVAAPGEGGSPVVFLDVETTALDRGAGALAFMVGIAAFHGDCLRVEQWVLTRLSAEAAMLAELVDRLGALAVPGAVLASFNGASFDVPLLRMRLQRARLACRPSGLERPHVDLLHPARRMWQGRDRDCRLGTLERTRLGVRRVHDLAGHEIPAVFWAWLRRPGDVEVRALMQRAADHNLADLVVLPALGAAIGECLAAPADLEAAVRAAQHLVVCGHRARALALLAGWCERPGPAPLRRRALLLAADLLRRDAGACGAPALWAEVCRIAPGDPTAHEALAKHLEHRVGDLEQALEVAGASATPDPRRLARLQRKLADRRPGPPDVGSGSVGGPLRPDCGSC